MPTPSEKLAQSLEMLSKLQSSNGAAAIRSRDLTRTHRERLLVNGFLQEVMKGWYIPSRPDEVKGESTAWYASFWRFSAVYLEERFSSELVSLAGTLPLYSCGQMDGTPAISREVPPSSQQSHEPSSRHVAAGSSRRITRDRRRGGNGRSACFLAGVGARRVFAELFYPQRDRHSRNIDYDPRCLRPSCPITPGGAQHDCWSHCRCIPQQRTRSHCR